MKRSELESKYLKKYRKQRNFCSKLYKKEKKKNYNNLYLKDIVDNNFFWKITKPFLSDKATQSSQITLVDENETLNNLFDKAVNDLKIKEDQYLLSSTSGIDDPVDIAVEKFKCHPSILEIKENVLSTVFHCKTVQIDIKMKSLISIVQKMELSIAFQQKV